MGLKHSLSRDARHDAKRSLVSLTERPEVEDRASGMT
jgi:hypothetical protein